MISRLEAFGAGIFRINLSHTKAEELEATIKQIQSITDVPICLDTEGAQIRTGAFAEDRIELLENSVVRGYWQKQAVARRDLTTILAEF